MSDNKDLPLGEKPLKIEVDMKIISISTLDLAEGAFGLRMYRRMKFYDRRLAYSDAIEPPWIYLFDDQPPVKPSDVFLKWQLLVQNQILSRSVIDSYAVLWSTDAGRFKKTGQNAMQVRISATHAMCTLHLKASLTHRFICCLLSHRYSSKTCKSHLTSMHSNFHLMCSIPK